MRPTPPPASAATARTTDGASENTSSRVASSRVTRSPPNSAREERPGEAVHLFAADTADQLDAGGDVPPLVAAADLQAAPEGLEEVEEVVSLQQHVTELGEGDSLLPCFETGLDRLLGHHGVDGE